MEAAKSGLLVNNEQINTIANNIANASTIGYKSSRPVFCDVFAHSRESHSTYGCGVGISNFINNFNDGMLIETGKNLDLGIAQDGFFRVIDMHNNTYYTRDGQFLLDKNKNIVNMQGMYLTGYSPSYFPNRFNSISHTKPINLQKADILNAKATSKIELRAILNRNGNYFQEYNYNGDLSTPIDYKTEMYIYDTNGQKEKVNVYFYKKNFNQWLVNIQSDNTNDVSKKKNIEDRFYLEFDSHGELSSEKTFTIHTTNEKYKDITLDLTGTVEQPTINNNVIHAFQNGYEGGYLQECHVMTNGKIVGTYSNNQTKSIGQILLSKFVNPEKLQYESGNLWSTTSETGLETKGVAGTLGFGTINEKTLEASNVDLNQELINMMIAQRNYQSNAQSFKIEDKAISALINLR